MSSHNQVIYSSIKLSFMNKCLIGFLLFFSACSNSTSNTSSPTDTTLIIAAWDSATDTESTTAALEPDDPLITPANGGRSIDGRSLRVGDILFSSTNTTASKLIRRFTGGGAASHVAVVSDIDANIVFIIEAITSGVRKVPLETFLGDNTNAVAFRYPSLSQQQVNAVSQYLNARVNSTDYDYFGAGMSPFFRLNEKKVKVDYGQGTSTRTYCSKLYIEAMSGAGISITTLTGGWSTPNDLVTLSWTDNLQYVGHLKYTQ